ncbi:MAG: hypothetical protein OEW39_16595 [Deltaproteobacteria bacterium]|nr:hypothetical protein [Deltaproteobacteria bacterium]
MTGWIILKVVHVFAGVLWMGGGVMMIFFIMPAVKATAQAGGTVMGHLSGTLKLPLVLLYAAWLTTLAGLALYWRATHGLSLEAMGTPAGLALTLGSVAGFLAFLGAVLVQLPRSKRMAQLGAQMGQKPSPETASSLAAEARKFALGGYVITVLFVLSLLGMLLSHPV